jgi:hypothetical protein
MSQSSHARTASGLPGGPGRPVRAATPARSTSIAIVDEHGRIVGWTDITPVIRGTTLRQPDAERLLGGAFLANYVRIENPEDAARAGAPAGWSGAWRCLALCSTRLIAARTGDPIVPVVASPRRGIA